MIEHRCEYGHVTFSSNNGQIICSLCKLISFPINQLIIEPNNNTIKKQKIVEYFCACGKKKAKYAIRCMDCSSELRLGKKVKAFMEELERKRKMSKKFDWVTETKKKIIRAKKNIERWEKMLEQNEKMNKKN